MPNDITIKFKSTGLTQLQKDIKSIDSQIKELVKSGGRIEIGAGLPSTSKAAQGLANAMEQAGLNTARFTANLDKLEGKLQGTARQASRFGDVVTGIGQGIGQGIFDTLAGSVSGVGSEIATNTLQFEKFNTVLTTTLGSQQLAAEAFQKIQKFAATTPFQLDEVLGSFIKLQNRGIEPTNELLTSLGDLASSQGKSLDQVTEALLDAQTGEFERLKEFGIQASSAGDRVTLSFKGVTQTVAKTPEAISKVIAGFGQLEGVAGGMASQAQTLGGQLSNLQDSATAASVSFGSALAPSIQKIVETINANSAGIGEFADEFGGNLAIAFEKVIQLGSEVNDAFAEIVAANPELKELGESVQNFLGVAFEVSLDSVRRFIQGLKTITNTQAFGTFVQVVTGGLNAIAKSFDVANQVLNALFDGISSAIGTIDGAVKAALDNNALRVFTAGIAGSIDLLTVSLTNAEDVLARLNLAKSKQASTGVEGLGDVAGEIEKDATKTIEVEAKKRTKVKKESAGDQEKLAKEAADREKKIIEDLTQASQDANDEILRSERDRLTQIDQLQARGVRNGGITQAEAEKLRSDEAGKRIKQQLAEEEALRAELASKSFSDPKLEEQRQQQIRSSVKKTADLQDAAIQNEIKQQQALVKIVQEKIDKQFNQARNSLTAQSQQLERQNNLLSTQTSLLDGQQRLLQSRANLQRAISDFQKSQFSIALDLLDSQFAAEDKLQQQQKSRADLLKKINDSSASTEDRNAAREELAQLDRQIEREQFKDQLRLEAAKAEFQQKLVLQELDRKSLEVEQKKAVSLLQQEVIRNRIAQIDAQIATNQAKADLAKAKADPTTTPEALRALELSISDNQEKQDLLSQQGTLLQQQIIDQKTLNEEEKKEQQLRQQVERTQAQADIAKLTPGTQDDQAIARSALENARRSRPVSTETPTIDPTKPQPITATAPVPVQIVQGGDPLSLSQETTPVEGGKPEGNAKPDQKGDQKGNEEAAKDPITRMKQFIELQIAAANVVEFKLAAASRSALEIQQSFARITPPQSKQASETPKIPGLKDGGGTSDVQWVGEAGKELLVSPPRGSYVLNHKDAMAIAQAAIAPKKLASYPDAISTLRLSALPTLPALPTIPTTVPKVDLPSVPGGNAVMVSKMLGKLTQMEQTLTEIKNRPATPAINFNQQVDRNSYDQLVALRSLLINTRF